MDAKALLAVKGATINAVRPDSPLSEAVHLLTEKNVGAILVTEESGELAGVLSERDIIRHLSKKGKCELGTKAGDLMTRDVIVCTPESSLDAAISAMIENMIRHLPVMEDNRPLGLISIKDALTYRLRALEQGEEQRFSRWFEHGRIYSLRD